MQTYLAKQTYLSFRQIQPTGPQGQWRGYGRANLAPHLFLREYNTPYIAYGVQSLNFFSQEYSMALTDRIKLDGETIDNIAYLNMEFSAFVNEKPEEEENMQVKVTGPIFPHLYAVFGKRLRLNMEICWSQRDEALFANPQQRPSIPLCYTNYGYFDDSKLWEAIACNRKYYDTELMKPMVESGVAVYFKGQMEYPEVLKAIRRDPRRAALELMAVANVILSVMPQDSPDQGINLGIEDITQKILQEKVETDLFVILTSDQNKVVRCHKSFLVAHSQVFRDMLASLSLDVVNEEEMVTEEESPTKLVIEDMNEETLRNLLAFLYCRDLNPARENSLTAVMLLQAALKYQVIGLEQELKFILLPKPAPLFPVNAAVALFDIANRMSGNQDWNLKAVNVLKAKSEQEIRGSDYYVHTLFDDVSMKEKLFEAISVQKFWDNYYYYNK